ncbi:MAG: tRNA lysidine(34) synthetase TilS [Pirellulales bacterium]|nr:tRNA lysidine(34) synthetase TilS [Pirellulales bacterium]
MAAHPPLEEALAAAWPPKDWQEVTVLLAISGGADSMALLRAMHALKQAGAGRLVVGHFNHGLRADAANRDERFVVELCDRLDVLCEVGRPKGANLTEPGQDGIEAAARRARYAFLQRVAAKWGARFVVTAHTADDQAETILHRIVRGTGVAGLSGIARARPLCEATTLLRPMLGIRRADVLAYLHALDQPYCDDETNADTQFTRNRIRHRLLPLLEAEFNTNAVDAILRLGTLAGEVQEVFAPIVDQLLEQCLLESTPERVRLRIPLDSDRYLVRELLVTLWRRQSWPLQAMGLAEWDALAGMALSGQPGKRTFPGNVTAVFESGQLILERQ